MRGKRGGERQREKRKRGRKEGEKKKKEEERRTERKKDSFIFCLWSHFICDTFPEQKPRSLHLN